MTGTLSPESISPKLDRIAQLARQAPEMVLTTLAHHVDAEFLAEAYRRTRKDAAVGVDGQTAYAFEQDLQANLQRLVDGLKSGSYKAPPVRRVYIPKASGGQRALGVPTFSDKVLQRGVTMLLEAVYEQDFLDCSYGFRPGRSAHQALHAVRDGLMRMRGGWVLEVDIERFFDTLDHSHLRAFLDQRVRDGVLRRMIDKWLKAGVLERGALMRSESGSPQGAVVSPILANVYLHHVLDVWFESVVKPRLCGHAFLVRYCDDFVICFAREDDARRVMDVLPKRFGRYGLALNQTKTRLIRFEPPPPGGGNHGSGSFDLLGFTHFWARSRQGYWVVKHTTSKHAFARALRTTAQWCRRNRHLPISEQHRMLSHKLQGHYAYYGITGNSQALAAYRHHVTRSWRKWLSRRSQRGGLSWDRFHRILARYPLPPARVVHSVYKRA